MHTVEYLNGAVYLTYVLTESKQLNTYVFESKNTCPDENGEEHRQNRLRKCKQHIVLLF